VDGQKGSRKAEIGPYEGYQPATWAVKKWAPILKSENNHPQQDGL
jgi:hypothetical protein